MEDLRALNKRILTQMGAVNVNLLSTLNLLSVCLGKLSHQLMNFRRLLPLLLLLITKTPWMSPPSTRST